MSSPRTRQTQGATEAVWTHLPWARTRVSGKKKVFLYFYLVFPTWSIVVDSEGIVGLYLYVCEVLTCILFPRTWTWVHPHHHLLHRHHPQMEKLSVSPLGRVTKTPARILPPLLRTQTKKPQQMKIQQVIQWVLIQHLTLIHTHRGSVICGVYIQYVNV